MREKIVGLNQVSDIASPGQLLRQAREKKKLSVDDLAQKTHLRPGLIIALEKDDYSEIGSYGIFIKGYLKLAARTLGMKEEELTQAFEQLKTVEVAPMPQFTPLRSTLNAKPKKRRTYWVRWFGLIVILALLGWAGFKGFLGWKTHDWNSKAHTAVPSVNPSLPVVNKTPSMPLSNLPNSDSRPLNPSLPFSTVKPLNLKGEENGIQ